MYVCVCVSFYTLFDAVIPAATAKKLIRFPSFEGSSLLSCSRSVEAPSAGVTGVTTHVARGVTVALLAEGET